MPELSISKQTVVVRSAFRRVGLLAMFWAGASAMAPLLPEPDTLAGSWAVKEQGSGTICPLKLTPRPWKNGFSAEHDGECFAALRLAGVTIWRPASDGIALADATGRTLAFFSRERDGYVVRRPDGSSLVLTKPLP